MKVGDRVTYQYGVENPRDGELTKLDHMNSFGRKISEVYFFDRNEKSLVFTESIKLSEPKIDEFKLFKEELLEILEFNKSAEEILLDIRDYLTN